MNYGSCPEMHLIANGLELFGYYKFMRSLMSEKWWMLVRNVEKSFIVGSKRHHIPWIFVLGVRYFSSFLGPAKFWVIPKAMVLIMIWNFCETKIFFSPLCILFLHSKRSCIYNPILAFSNTNSLLSAPRKCFAQNVKAQMVKK